jgi:type IV secretory pathway TraG/TraD family ATPase VirD4
MPTNVILQGTSLNINGLPKPLANAKVVLSGTIGGKAVSFGLDDDILSKHTLFVGGTGCGKSNLFYHFVKQLKAKMGTDDVMIIFDTKGDFYDKFRPSPRKDVVLGNSPKYRVHPERWNVFREVLADGWEDRDIVINTQEICKAFFEERTENNSNNPFFPNAARDVLAMLMIALVRSGDYAGSKDKNDYCRMFLNNKMLKAILDEYTVSDILEETCVKYSDMSRITTYIGGKGSKQAEGVLAELYSVASDIFRGVFAEKGGFSMRKFIREKGGRTVYIEYDLSSGSVLAPIYTLLFDLALKEALGRTAGTNGNVYLIVDELKLLPRLQHMDDGINFGRSLGVKIFAGLQSIEQLYADYKEADAKNIIAGFSSIYVFRANDPRTREYARDLFGENLTVERYLDTKDSLIDAPPRLGHTVEDWELRRLRTGEAIVGLAGRADESPPEPFKIKFDMYKG